jgi:hypothetical protein
MSNTQQVPCEHALDGPEEMGEEYEVPAHNNADPSTSSGSYDVGFRCTPVYRRCLKCFAKILTREVKRYPWETD